MSPDFIAVYENALDPNLCDQIVELFENRPQDQSAGEIGTGVDLNKKNSLDCCISRHQEWVPFNQEILNVTIARLCEYVRQYPYLICGALAPTLQFRSGEIGELTEERMQEVPDDQLAAVLTTMYRPGYLNLQKYLAGTGGFHHWHSEVYPKEANCETLHRVLLFMFFLNDVETGGETEFLYQEKRIAPQKGSMVIAPAGFTHTHKGHIPISDDKYIVTSWILFQRAEELYAARQSVE